MFCKIKQRYLSAIACFLLGLFLHLFIFSNISPVVASSEISSIVKTEQNPIALEQQGKHFYAIYQFDRAISFWHEAYQIYRDRQDIFAQSRVLSSLALAHGQLSNWKIAEANIDRSLELLNDETVLGVEERERVLALVLNNKGILQLTKGETEGAINSWQQAAISYERVGDEVGKIRASINQASAFKNLGLYRRALKTLVRVENNLKEQPDSILKATGLRNYGDILRLVGNKKDSRTILEDSLLVSSSLTIPLEEVKTLLALGHTFSADEKPEKAFEFYQQGLKKCLKDRACEDSDLSLQINLAQLNLLLKTAYWQRGITLIPEIQANFAKTENNKNYYHQKINFAHNLVKLRQKAIARKLDLENIPSWQEIESIAISALQNAREIEDKRAESYALGLRGQINEHLQNLSEAQKCTQDALVVAQNFNSPEISYLWQWQLARISEARGERKKAISHYSQAVELLKSLSQDLVAIDPDIQYSFRESVEPVYRGLVSLLLTHERGVEIAQANLEGARDVIESLQLAELNNFFREACLDARSVKIDRLDRQAAVIYPIILADRLEIILSLPEQPLRNYSVDISQTALEDIIEEFRQSIVVRSRRHFDPLARQLYDYLIRPLLKDLQGRDIKTLVFVPDGSLRNIPMSALSDGKQYLVEQYSVSLTPGLQLLAPRPLEQTKLKAIAAGLTESRQGFTALNYVHTELDRIQEHIKNSIVFLDEKFTSETLKQQIKFSDRPIVHIATHGQFSSSLEDTFLLAWDRKINIDRLDSILQTRTLNRDNAIELLVLSACETATGDKWAALGLAGMAVRAGARSTLATLWSVNDLASAELMSEFYEQLSENKLPKAEAVRQAQLKFIHSRWHNHPFYWASYVLLGNWL